MQVILLLEFIMETMFVFIRCLATNDEEDPTIDISFRAFLLIRAIYAVPVLILNASILWMGGGKAGECKLKDGEVRMRDYVIRQRCG